MAEGLALFVSEAARLHEYREVLWAAKRYRGLFPIDPTVEICSAIAHVAASDDQCALSILEELGKRGYDPKDVALRAGDLLGRFLELNELTASALLDAIVNVVRSERPRPFHPMHGN